MDLRRTVTGALAWAGLVIVIGVPSADLVLSKFRTDSAATVTPEAIKAPEKPGASAATAAAGLMPPATAASSVAVEPAKATRPSIPAAVASATSDAAASGDASTDPVQEYLATHKTLPSYLTPGKSRAAENAPAPAADSKPAGSKPGAVPLLEEDAPPSAATAAARVPAADAGQAAAPVASVATTGGAASGAVPVPKPAPARPKPQASRTVTEADLKDWKSGSLEDYLRSHGLLSAAPADQTGN